MRLTSEQVDHIVKTVNLFASAQNYEIFLYGSRIQDELKGGDIDLLVVANNTELSNLEDNQYKILNLIKKNPLLGDRRIDLKIATKSQLDTDPFLKIISAKMIKLG